MNQFCNKSLVQKETYQCGPFKRKLGIDPTRSVSSHWCCRTLHCAPQAFRPHPVVLTSRRLSAFLQPCLTPSTIFLTFIHWFNKLLLGPGSGPDAIFRDLRQACAWFPTGLRALHGGNQHW